MEESEEYEEEYGYEDEDAVSNSKPRWLFFVIIGVIFLVVLLVALMIVGKKGDKDKGKAGKETSEYNYIAPTAGEIEDECEKKSGGEAAISLCKDDVAANKAINSGNFDDCAAVKDAAIKNNCMLRISRQAGSVNLCKKISDESTRRRCLSGVAVDARDIKICDNLETADQTDCKEWVLAYSISEDGDKNSLSKCRELKDSEYADMCLINSYINKYGGNCTLVPAAFQENCLQQFHIK